MPVTFQDTPHKNLRKYRTAMTQREAIFCKDTVLINGYKIIIINDVITILI